MGQNNNILFSTTRQWNPGDEFILMGILNIMRSIDADFNPIIFNRNPEIQRSSSGLCFNFQFNIPRMRVKRLKSGYYDNSFKEKFLKYDFIDLAVFAGTPEWGSPRLKSMYEYINKYAIPTLYLGIGIGARDFNIGQLDIVYQSVLKKAKLITVRDRLCQQLLPQFNAILLPCPALLAAPERFEKNIDRVKKIGLIYSSDKTIKYNRVDKETYCFTAGFYKQFLERYSGKFDIEFICHYIDELPEFYKDFRQYKCRYSYESRDYLDIYHNFDMVIGTRVHGIGLAASMGIPGVYIEHDDRANTCEGFFAEMIRSGIQYSDAFRMIDGKIEEINKINKRILDHKRTTFQKYTELLAPILKS